MVAIGILALVLVQQGKGSDIGAAFGSGASNTMFGSAGSTSFLMKITIVLVAIFFCTSLALNYYTAHTSKVKQTGILNLPTTTVPVNNHIHLTKPVSTTASVKKQQNTNHK